IIRGAQFARRLVRRAHLNVVHARSHPAAAMGALATTGTGARLIFDIRGFLPEEYADAGIWPAGGHLFRLTKAAERRLLNAADGFVVLTKHARRILFADQEVDERGRPIEVIPCCVDLARFHAAAHLVRAEVREELQLTGRRVAVYVGALGGFYLTDEMADFLATAHTADATTFSLILTQSEPEMIAGRLRARGVAAQDFLVRKVAPAEIPRYLKAADFALSFIKPAYSKLSSSPTKVAEYLAAGLPIVCNAGIGDVDEVIGGERVGVIIHEFNRAAYLAALSAVDELRADAELATRCQRAAHTYFDLEQVGGARYRRLYRRLLDVSSNGNLLDEQRAPAAAPTNAGAGEN
ncbi:MAG TPA: glycosyltransferase, partial [Pyrinomonadaceae bacterium]|nr:glycosyltransferase [Pyrinomonadaceae bacterium]